MSLIQGETVYVLEPTTETDVLGDPVPGFSEPVEVGNVVVIPGATSDMDATRPNGVEVAYTLCFPKTFAGDLRGRSVKVRGKVYGVVGDPQRYAEENTPGPWNLTAEVARADG